MCLGIFLAFVCVLHVAYRTIVALAADLESEQQCAVAGQLQHFPLLPSSNHLLLIMCCKSCARWLRCSAAQHSDNRLHNWHGTVIVHSMQEKSQPRNNHLVHCFVILSLLSLNAWSSRTFIPRAKQVGHCNSSTIVLAAHNPLASDRCRFSFNKCHFVAN